MEASKKSPVVLVPLEDRSSGSPLTTSTGCATAAYGPSAQTPSNELTLQERDVDLAGSPPALATAAVPGLAKMASTLYARMNWHPSEFRGMRIHVKHPPMSSRVVMRWPLE